MMPFFLRVVWTLISGSLLLFVCLVPPPDDDGVNYANKAAIMASLLTIALIFTWM